MLPVTDARVANNLQWNDGILVLCLNESKDGELVDAATHGHSVVTRLEDKVGDQRVADGFAINGKVHCDVAKIEGHD